MTPQERDILIGFQAGVAEWKRRRRGKLIFGVVTLGTSVWLLSMFFRTAGFLDELGAGFSKLSRSDELARATAQTAVLLALRAATGIVTGLFGLYQVVTTVRDWTGRPEHAALSVIIEREFGIGKPRPSG